MSFDFTITMNYRFNDIQRCFFWAVWLFLVSTLSCKHDPDINAKLLSDGTPRILAIRFPGIPDQDVTIDQPNRRITVKMPATLSVDDLTPTLILNGNARLARPLTSIGRLEAWASCCNYPNLVIQLEQVGGEAGKAVTEYTIRPEAAGVLDLEGGTTPLDYIIDGNGPGSVVVRMKNLYGADEEIAEALVTHVSSGDTVTVRSEYRIWITATPIANTISIWLYDRNLRLGEHRITLRTTKKREIKVTQPLIVRKGPVTISQFKYSVLRGSKLVVKGLNFFEGDVTLRVKDGQDKVIPTSVDFTPYGLQMIVSLPASTPVGVYIMQILTQNNALPTCFKVTVLPDNRPRATITDIQSSSQLCSFADPVNLNRGRQYSITYSSGDVSYYDSITQLRLTRIDDASQVVLARIDPWRDERGPYLNIPANTPPGRYIGVLQIVDQTTKKTVYSDPFEHSIDIQ